jgi:hypothetical protein
MELKDFTQIVANKVGKDDLDKICEQKANKEDTENLMDNIRMLNSQLQHTVVLMNETVKLSL